MTSIKTVIKIRPINLKVKSIFDTLPINTGKAYTWALLKMSKDIFNKPYFDPNMFLSHESDIVNYLETKPYGTRRTMLPALFKAYEIMNYSSDKYDKLQQCWIDWKQCVKVINSKDEKKLNDWNLSRVDECRHEFELKSIFGNYNSEDYTYFLLSSLYSLYPPLRQADWCNTKFVQWDNKLTKGEVINKAKELGNNVLSLSHQRLVLITHKNKKEPRYLYIPDELMDILHYYYDNFKPVYVISCMNDMTKPMKSSNVCEVLNKIFGFSVDNLRRLFDSSMLNHLTDIEKNRMAQFMGHSSQTAKDWYGTLSVLNQPTEQKIKYYKKLLEITYE